MVMVAIFVDGREEPDQVSVMQFEYQLEAEKFVEQANAGGTRFTADILDLVPKDEGVEA